jgi:5-methylthioadenosine/S-adenosylhomocysteine deaminase
MTALATPSSSGPAWPRTADLLVVGGDVVTMDSGRRVIVSGAVAVRGSRIAMVGSAAVVRAAFPAAPELDATNCVVTPGLVNAHQHTTGDPLARSAIPDDIDSRSSIFQWAVPLHAAHQAMDLPAQRRAGRRAGGRRPAVRRRRP